jgi:hypothetical protein
MNEIVFDVLVHDDSRTFFEHGWLPPKRKYRFLGYTTVFSALTPLSKELSKKRRELECSDVAPNVCKEGLNTNDYCLSEREDVLMCRLFEEEE